MNFHKAVIACAAMSLVLVGCGSDAKEAKGSANVGEEAGTSLTKENFVTEIAKAQKEAKTSHVDMKIGVSGQEITATGDVGIADKPEDTKMDLGASGMGAEGIEMRLIDQKLYMNMGPMTSNKFAEIDLGDENDPIAKQFGGTLDQLDPSKTLEQFGDAVKTFEKKGKAVELDGVQAQPYELTLDGSKLEGLTPMGGEQASAQVPENLAFTFFVGPDNLPRRMTSDISGSKLQIDYSKWGEAIDVEAPAKDQITDSSFLDQTSPTPSA